MSDYAELTASSLSALAEQYRAIAHNLANVSTPGYKRLQTSFVRVLEAAAAGAGEATSPPSGQISPDTTVDFRQGALTQTGHRLDLALDGSGFFVVESPDGTLYTRNGKFRTNAQGQLTDASGRTVVGEGGPLIIPTTVSLASVSVSPDGTVAAGSQAIGKLKIVDFEDPSQLTPVGDHCLEAPGTVQPIAAETTRVRQGFFESSNVSAIEELIGLITVTRLYEANVKALTVQDEQMKNILNVLMS